MFDMGGLELLLITVVALLVIGPERLPDALRTLGLGLGRLRRSFNSIKTEIEKEIGMDEVRRQLHSEAVMEEMKRIEREVKKTADEARIDPSLDGGSNLPQAEPEPEPATTEPSPAEQSPAPAEQSSDEQKPEQTQPEQLIDSSPAEESDMATEPAATTDDTPLPRSEAEVEAAFERKTRAHQSSTEQQS